MVKASGKWEAHNVCSKEADPTYLPCNVLHDGFGTLLRRVQQVVKVSSGQYPQPFWISAVKRAAAKIKAGPAKPKY